jgi:hypothetical protein
MMMVAGMMKAMTSRRRRRRWTIPQVNWISALLKDSFFG